jgi:hypothetical protein
VNSCLVPPSYCSLEPAGTGIRQYGGAKVATQYAAGALYRWAAYGYQSGESLLSQPDGAQQKQEIDGEPGARATWAMGLLSKADELEQDREDVFGGNSLEEPLSVGHSI